jgi:enoyl-CoA hydratase/carnithine racemase
VSTPQRRASVTWNKDGSIVEVILDGPPANALGPDIVEGLHAAMDFAETATAKVLLVTSAITGFFAAGADIKHMSAVDAASFREYGNALRAGLERLSALPMVSVAANDGLALGGGLELAMACTMRVAATGARLGLPEVKLGLIPGAGGTQRLPRLVGRGRALDIMLTGRQVEADEAFWIGLIDRLAEPGETARAAAWQLAHELAAASTPAQLAVVRTVDAAYDRPIHEGLRYEVEQVQELFERGEAMEGLRAFIAKRAPEFV